VSEDEILQWIDGLPASWRPPKELAEPTNSALVNFVIIVLTSPFSSNTVNENVALLLAEKERFSAWFLVDEEPSR
jgi:hypothetical protein